MKKLRLFQTILNISIIILFLLVEYLWFRKELAWAGIRFSFLGIRISIFRVYNPAIILFLLIGLKIFFVRKRIYDWINGILRKTKLILIDKEWRFTIFCLVGIIIFSFVIKIPAVMYAEGYLDADVATEGIMAMHIFQGRHHPINHYRLSYNGTTKSHFGALLFHITGVTPKALEITNLCFFFPFLLFAYFLTLKVFNKEAALITAILLGVSPPFLYYLSVYIGGYLEIILYGAIVLLLTVRYIDSIPIETPKWYFCIVGFLGGFGFWTQSLMAVFVITSLTLLFLKDIKYFLKHIFWRFISFSFIGCFPFILYNIKTHGATLRCFMHPPKAEVGIAFVQRIRILIANLLNAFGNTNISGNLTKIDYKWGGTIFWVCLYTIAFVYFLYKYNSRLKYWVFILPVVFTIVLNLHTFRTTISGRYMTPLYICLPLFLALWISRFRGKWQYIKYLILILFLCNNLYFNMKQILHYKKRGMELTTLISKLKEMGIRYVGTGFWQAYPITFLTKEEIICTGHFGISSSDADEDDPVTFDRYLPYRDSFFKELKNNPQDVAFLFEYAASDYDENFISTIKEPLKKTTIGKYDIYTFKNI